MLLHGYKSAIVTAATLLMLAGCATLSFITGADTYWGRTAPVTKQARAYALHIAGMMYERRGEMERAAEAWTAVINLDEMALAPRLRLIRAHLRNGDHEKALSICRDALKRLPDTAELWIVYGELNHRLGNIEEAIAAFMKTIEISPDNLTGYGALIELQESTNDLVAAIDIYEKLIERSPNSAALYYQLGINLARIKDVEYARDTFQRVLELEPRITQAHFFLALTLFELGDFERCAEEMHLYLSERPGDVAALEYRAAALARLGHLEKARYTLELLMAGNEAAPKHYLQYAWILLELEQTERAQQFALEAGAYLFADIIFACDLLRTVPLAEQPSTPWDDRFSLDDVEAESDLFIAAVLNMFDEKATSQKIFAMLDSLNDFVAFSPPLAFFRARLLLFLEQYAEAIDTLLTIHSNGVVSKHTHYHSAVAYEKSGDFQNTEKHLVAYLEINPDDPDVLNFLGYFYAEHNVHLDKAEELLNRALKQDPENPYYLDSLGWIYYKQGKAQEAEELIRRALYGMDSDDAELRDHLGDVYLLQGDTERALREWQRALRLDPSLDAVQKKIEKHQRSQD